MSARDPGAAEGTFVHATACLLGAAGVLLRGAPGSGKTSLAALLIRETQRAGSFACLVGDDRVAIANRHGRIVARGHPAIAGLMERRTAGICRVPFEPACVIRMVIDLQLGAPLERLPSAHGAGVDILGVTMPRLLVGDPRDSLVRNLILEKLSSDF